MNNTGRNLLSVLLLSTAVAAAQKISEPAARKPVPAEAEACATATARVDLRCMKAKAKGIGDDTSTVQAALDLYSRQNATGAILCAGTYRITSTLVYVGNTGLALKFEGNAQDRGGSGRGGCALIWDGPAGGTVLKLVGANNSEVRDVAIDGGGKAKYGIWIDYTLDGTNARLRSSSSNLLDSVTVGGLQANGSAIAIGNAQLPNGQASEITFSNLVLNGRDSSGKPGYAKAGLEFLTAGNTKNFRCDNCNINGFQYGIAWSGSGMFALNGQIFAANTVSDMYADMGHLTVNGCESEGSRRLLYAAATATTSGSTNAHIVGCHWVGDGPDDNIIIKYPGALFLANNELRNNHTASSPVLIQVGVEQNGNHVNQAGSIFSVSNFYFNDHDSDGRRPWIDYSGRQYFRKTGPTVDSTLHYASGWQLALTSIADRGGIDGHIEQFESIWASGGYVTFDQLRQVAGAAVLDGTAPLSGTLGLRHDATLTMRSQDKKNDVVVLSLDGSDRLHIGGPAGIVVSRCEGCSERASRTRTVAGGAALANDANTPRATLRLATTGVVTDHAPPLASHCYAAMLCDFAGPGSPEGVLAARRGSTYRRIDPGSHPTFYVKESGSGKIGWRAK